MKVTIDVDVIQIYDDCKAISDLIGKTRISRPEGTAEYINLLNRQLDLNNKIVRLARNPEPEPEPRPTRGGRR